MAEKDLSTRGKEEVAFFAPTAAASYTCFGMLGHHYNFSKKEPAKVTLACDIKMFREKRDIAECDAGGNLLGQSDEGPKPLSYSKTAPPEPTGKNGGEIRAETETLTTDKPRKAKKIKKGKGGKKKAKEADKESPPEKEKGETDGADSDDVDSIWD